MKSLFILAFVVVCCTPFTYSQPQSEPNPVATALFKDIKSKLSPAEQNSIAVKLGFVLSGNKEQPFAQDKDSKDYPFAATVLPTDMNKDGIEEIFITFGNSYTSGINGSSIVLFIKNNANRYFQNLGFPGTIPHALTTTNQGYPDLLIGGAGMQYPVYRWNGKNYALYKKVNDSDFEKLKKMNIEEVSKLYLKKQLRSIYLLCVSY